MHGSHPAQRLPRAACRHRDDDRRGRPAPTTRRAESAVTRRAVALPPEAVRSPDPTAPSKGGLMAKGIAGASEARIQPEKNEFDDNFLDVIGNDFKFDHAKGLSEWIKN